MTPPWARRRFKRHSEGSGIPHENRPNRVGIPLPDQTAKLEALTREQLADDSRRTCEGEAHAL